MTATTVFVGPAAMGPVGVVSPAIRSAAEFETSYGGAMGSAVRAFFAEGGEELAVVRAERYESALPAVSGIDGPVVIAAPGGVAADASVPSLLVRQAESMRQGFALIEAGPWAAREEVQRLRAAIDSDRAALYYPWAVSGGGLVAPSALVAAVYSRVDRARGAWRPAGNEPLRSVERVAMEVTHKDCSLVNPMGINCLRMLPEVGTVVWGVRTCSANPEYRYVHVRRYVDWVVSAFEHGLEWAMQEENGEALWAKMRAWGDSFLLKQWREGALLGRTPAEAWFVRCDRSVMAKLDIESGRIVMVAGMALLKAGEFHVIRMSLRRAARLQ